MESAVHYTHLMSSENTTTKKRRGPAPTIKDARRITFLLPADLVTRIEALGNRSEVMRKLLEYALDSDCYDPAWGLTDSVDGD